MAAAAMRATSGPGRPGTSLRASSEATLIDVRTPGRVGLCRRAGARRDRQADRCWSSGTSFPTGAARAGFHRAAEGGAREAGRRARMRRSTSSAGRAIAAATRRSRRPRPAMRVASTSSSASRDGSGRSAIAELRELESGGTAMGSVVTRRVSEAEGGALPALVAGDDRRAARAGTASTDAGIGRMAYEEGGSMADRADPDAVVARETAAAGRARRGCVQQLVRPRRVRGGRQQHRLPFGADALPEVVDRVALQRAAAGALWTDGAAGHDRRSRSSCAARCAPRQLQPQPEKRAEAPAPASAPAAPAAPVAPLPRRGPSRTARFAGSPVDPRYTFETFCEGAANRVAFAAAQAVAETPSGKPTPVQPALHPCRRRPRQDAPSPCDRRAPRGAPSRAARSSISPPSTSCSASWRRSATSRRSSSRRRCATSTSCSSTTCSSCRASRCSRSSATCSTR